MPTYDVCRDKHCLSDIFIDANVYKIVVFASKGNFVRLKVMIVVNNVYC